MTSKKVPQRARPDSSARNAARRRIPLGRVLLVLFLALPGAAVARVQIVRVGVYQNPPKIFLSKGRISGIFGDLIYKLADREGWTIVPVPCKWQQCLSMVRHGKIDLMPDVAFSEQRAKHMRFGKTPALYSWSQLYRNPHTHLLTIHDLAGKRVAVLAGSIQEHYLKAAVKNLRLSHVQFVATDSFDKAFQLTAEGKADAVAANKFFGNLEAVKFNLRSTPIIFQPSQLYFVTPKGRDIAVLASMDTYLSRWETEPDSFYFKTLKKWKAGQRSARVPDVVWWTLGALLALLVIAMLVTWLLRRKVLEKTRTLETTESKHALILDSVDAYIYIKDLDLRYQYVNRRLADLFGLPAAAITGQSDDRFFDAETAAHIRATDERVLRHGERITLEEDSQTKHGERRNFLSVKQPLRDATGQIYAMCGVSTDFTEHRRNEEKIRQLALFDSLTGLPNRSLLLDRLQHALDGYTRTRSEGALLFIDLDNFKVLNDTLGHVQGDALLQQAAARLKQHIRHTDTLARLGGDEFVLLMEQLGQDSDIVVRDIEVVANKLLHAFNAHPCLLDSSSHNVSISVGVALFSDAEQRVDELLKRADMAMYAAKAAGRNQVKFFNPQMQSALAERAAMEAELHDALHHKQFALLYQPLVDSTGHVFGAEALVRWNHPKKGTIPPGAFIPVAETTGQIIPLGNWIFREACRQLVTWRDSPACRHLSISVNVSARQFHHPDFVSNLTGVIEETGADPHHLELELTESMLVDDIEAVIEKMKALKALGVHFSLDDFGTGYSSLSYLKRLPLDQLKIDQSFVRDLLVDPNDVAIVRTVLALGESLNLAVIAEGVETTAQRDTLLALGCVRLQGYLFGCPGPPASLLPMGTDIAN